MTKIEVSGPSDQPEPSPSQPWTETAHLPIDERGAANLTTSDRHTLAGIHSIFELPEGHRSVADQHAEEMAGEVAWQQRKDRVERRRRHNEAKDD